IPLFHLLASISTVLRGPLLRSSLPPPSSLPRTMFFLYLSAHLRPLPSFPTRRSSDLPDAAQETLKNRALTADTESAADADALGRSEEHTSELQSLTNIVCRLLLEKKKNKS